MASISGESLQVRFVEVTCAVRVTVDGTIEDVAWKQPGLTAEQSRIAYKGYQFAFEVEPYPEAGRTINKDEYRIMMVVSKG